MFRLRWPPDGVLQVQWDPVEMPLACKMLPSTHDLQCTRDTALDVLSSSSKAALISSPLIISRDRSVYARGHPVTWPEVTT